MSVAVFLNGKRFNKVIFKKEEDFEDYVAKNSKLLFGKNTIYLNIKKKIESNILGNSIPDGILFDLRDIDNPEFYLVEVELAKHDFYRHIFPQITKFFAFYNNPKGRKKLVSSLDSLIKSDNKLERVFRRYLGKKEIYKWLEHTVENSQNILIVIDDEKPEFDEMAKTYQGTWGKQVKVEILNIFKSGTKKIFILNPDFEGITFVGGGSIPESASDIYTEQFHLDGVSKNVSEIYSKIKSYILKIDPNVKINPQRYYISLRKNKNFAFIYLRKKKVKVVVMLPYDQGKEIIKKNSLKKLSKGIQDFYNGECFAIMINSPKYLDEVFTAIKKAYESQNKTET